MVFLGFLVLFKGAFEWRKGNKKEGRVKLQRFEKFPFGTKGFASIEQEKILIWPKPPPKRDGFFQTHLFGKRPPRACSCLPGLRHFHSRGESTLSCLSNASSPGFPSLMPPRLSVTFRGEDVGLGTPHPGTALVCDPPCSPQRHRGLWRRTGGILGVKSNFEERSVIISNQFWL